MVIFYNVSKWPAAGQGSLYAPFNACLQSPEYVCKVVVCDLRIQLRLIAPCRSLGRLAKKRNDSLMKNRLCTTLIAVRVNNSVSRSLRIFLDFNCRHKRLNFFRRFFFFSGKTRQHLEKAVPLNPFYQNFTLNVEKLYLPSL